MKLLYIIFIVLSKQCRLPIILAFFYYSILAMNTHAASHIIINEIAWAGSSTSPNDEWIELYNPTDYTVDINGWHLSSDSNSPSIVLQGEIPAGGYFLLERSDDHGVPNITANQIYSGALSNTGEKMALADTRGMLQDEIDASSGWPAGDAKTKQTMERDFDLTGWHTGPTNGTPLAKNTVPAFSTATAKPKLGTLKTSGTKTAADPPTQKDNLQQQELLADVGTSDPIKFNDNLKDNYKQTPLDSNSIIGVIITSLIVFGFIFIYKYTRTRKTTE